MTRDRDIERILDHWFTERPTNVADRVLDDVADRIGRQPQQRAWPVLWRDSHVITYVKYAAAVAAVILVAAVGVARFGPPSDSNVGGGSGPVSQAPTATPSITVTPTVPPLAKVNHPFNDAFAWRLTLPVGWANSGWFVFPAELRPEGNDAENPNGLAVAVFDAPEILMDPCASDPDLSTTSTVAELVAAIQGQDEWVVSEPVDATAAGYSGQRLDVQLPADVSRCGENYYVVFLNPGATPDGVYAQGPEWQLRLWVLDVDGRLVVLARESFAATPANRLAEADAIIESSVFTP